MGPFFKVNRSKIPQVDQSDLSSAVCEMLKDDGWQDIVRHHFQGRDAEKAAIENVQNFRLQMFQNEGHFRQVGRWLALINFEANGSSDLHPVLSDTAVLEKNWTICTQKYNDLLWRTRSMAGAAANVIEELHILVFPFLKSPQNTAEEKLREIDTLIRSLPTPLETAQDISNGLLEVADDLTAFETRWHRFLGKHYTQLSLIPHDLVDIQNSLNVQLSLLQQKINRYTVLNFSTAGLATASLIALLCPAMWNNFVLAIVSAGGNYVSKKILGARMKEMELDRLNLETKIAENDKKLAAVESNLKQTESITLNLAQALNKFQRVRDGLMVLDNIWAVIRLDMQRIRAKIVSQLPNECGGISASTKTQGQSVSIDTTAGSYKILCIALKEYERAVF